MLPGIDRMKQNGKFTIDLHPNTIKWIKNLQDGGAEFRYYEASYCNEELDLLRFDRAVWEIRRYCQPLDYDIELADGSKKNMLDFELARVRAAVTSQEKGTCINGGVLEKIIAIKHHPAREPLIWNNLFFGPSKRKGVRLRPAWEAGNSPFFLHPEVIGEVVKYVFIPEKIADGVRVFAAQKAAEAAGAVVRTGASDGTPQGDS